MSKARGEHNGVTEKTDGPAEAAGEKAAAGSAERRNPAKPPVAMTAARAAELAGLDAATEQTLAFKVHPGKLVVVTTAGRKIEVPL
jgi:hypothetical protein